MSQSLIQDTFYTFLWSIVLLLWLLLDLIYSLFSLCSVKPSSAHKLYVAIAKRKGRGPIKLGPRLPLRLTSRASKKRDLEKGSHAIGFLYRCRTFPIFSLIFFSCKQKISVANRCVTPNLVQREYIANSNKIRIPPANLLYSFFYKEMCARGGNACTQGIFQKLLSFGSWSHETLHIFKIWRDSWFIGCDVVTTKEISDSSLKLSFYMATIVRALWLAAERTLFSCNDRALWKFFSTRLFWVASKTYERVGENNKNDNWKKN